jgi:hypothetical protein
MLKKIFQTRKNIGSAYITKRVCFASTAINEEQIMLFGKFNLKKIKKKKFKKIKKKVVQIKI